MNKLKDFTFKPSSDKNPNNPYIGVLIHPELGTNILIYKGNFALSGTNQKEFNERYNAKQLHKEFLLSKSRLLDNGFVFTESKKYDIKTDTPDRDYTGALINLDTRKYIAIYYNDYIAFQMEDNGDRVDAKGDEIVKIYKEFVSSKGWNVGPRIFLNKVYAPKKTKYKTKATELDSIKTLRVEAKEMEDEISDLLKAFRHRHGNIVLQIHTVEQEISLGRKVFNGVKINVVI